MPTCVRCFRNLRETHKPLALASRPTSIGPDRRRTLAYGSAYPPTTSTVKMQLAPLAVSSSSVDEVQQASCCWCCCHCRSYSRNHSSRNHSCTPASTASLSIGRGDVVRTARVPLLYPCRYARGKLSVRESDRRCSPLAFCPKRISVGRAHHYRKRMYSIRRFRTKLTFPINLMHCSKIVGWVPFHRPCVTLLRSCGQTFGIGKNWRRTDF